MDIFSQNKLLIRTILFLVVLNLGSITFFTIREMRPDQERDFANRERHKSEFSLILKKELNLTDAQFAKFEAIRKQNANRKSCLKATINQDKDSLNLEMFNKNYNEQKVLELARKIGDNEYNIELSKIEQSKKLKVICTPKQLDKFQNLMSEIRDYFRPIDQPRRQ